MAGGHSCTAGEMATTADSTHPTGMHSCSDLNVLQTLPHSSWHNGSIDSSLYLTTHL